MFAIPRLPVCAAEVFSNPLVFLHSSSSSRMTTKTVGKTPGAMNALRFRPKISDQVIIQRPGTEALIPRPGTEALIPRRPVTVPAGRRTGGAIDQITVRIDRMINGTGCRYGLTRRSFAAPDPYPRDEDPCKETGPSSKHIRHKQRHFPPCIMLLDNLLHGAKCGLTLLRADQVIHFRIEHLLFRHVVSIHQIQQDLFLMVGLQILRLHFAINGF